MFLYSMNDSVNNSWNDDNNKNNIITNNIIFIEYIDISYYNPKYYNININAIYDKNNDLEKTVKSILEIIPSKGLDFDKEKESLLHEIIAKENGNKNFQLKGELKINNKNEQILMINYLFNFNITLEISSLILYLFNKIILNKDKINIDSEDISLNKKNELYILGKVKYRKLKYVNFSDSSLYSNDSELIKNLFSSNLIKLDLSINKLNDIKLFENEENLINLSELDLSRNKI